MTLSQKRPATVAQLHEQFLTLVADVPYISIDERCFLFVQALKPKLRAQLKLAPHWGKLESEELALRGTMEDFNEFVRLAFEAETALQESEPHAWDDIAFKRHQDVHKPANRQTGW